MGINTMQKKIAVTIGNIILGLLIVTICNAQFFNEQGLKYMKLFGWIESQYVDTVNLDKISDIAIRELLHNLDPHSVYFTKDEVREMNEPLQGNFEGVGISFTVFKDTILVISVVPDGPSEKVGIIAGDRIVNINGENVAGVKITKHAVQGKLRGIKGSTVNIQVVRHETTGLLPFTIERDKIPIESIDASYTVDKTTGYIRLSRFSATTFTEISKIFNRFKSEGIENIILDLSGNTGGYLDIAVSLADEFLDSGKKIVYTQGVHTERKEYYSTHSGLFEKGKLVVMVDENSASASEIVAGAIQDWDRGVIIGRRSYGKGLVQRPFIFSDGSMIRLTVARYYTPSGRLIQKSYSNGYKIYNKELDERVKSGEIFGKDMKNIPDSLKYYTQIKKRVVFGGGGITPDIYVPIDTLRFTKLYKTLVSQGIFNSFVLEYIDTNRNSLKRQYPTFAQFKNDFEVDKKLLNVFNQYITNKNIKVIPGDFEKSIKEIHVALKANMAMGMWSSSEFYEIYNTLDPDFQKAVDVINNWNKYSNG
jgi:carboxyl-terminal processing protease